MPTSTNLISNPILPGFHPDPSICRVGEDYYLVNSTFSYFPGVPIFHSKDLVHWQQIGNVLTRKSQLDLTDSGHSGGIYAPTLRYHQGTYYMITTNIEHGGNFIVTAPSPTGPWSDPYFLGSEGIDPSLFFDEDGRCYYCGTKGRRDGEKFWGDNEIYVQELDLNTMQLIGESWVIWHSALRDAQWSEGPHIYKINGCYYLLIAEGGTGPDHAITVARSQDLHTYFEGNRKNPILTHRHLGKAYPIINTGHGDLVQTQNGDWYMVLLASRPYDDCYCNLGRETFLVPVSWEDGWPVCNPGKGIVESTLEQPKLPEGHLQQPLTSHLDFSILKELPPNVMYLRNPREENYILNSHTPYLQLKLSEECPGDTGVSPSAIFFRQTSFSYRLTAKMSFSPETAGEEAGIVLMQSDHYLYRFGITKGDEGSYKAVLIRCQGIDPSDNRHAVSETIAAASLPYHASAVPCPQDMCTSTTTLQVTANRQELCFMLISNGTTVTLADQISARILSTEIAGGFVGTCLGVYATSNHMPSQNTACFETLDYQPL